MTPRTSLPAAPAIGANSPVVRRVAAVEQRVKLLQTQLGASKSIACNAETKIARLTAEVRAARASKAPDAAALTHVNGRVNVLEGEKKGVMDRMEKYERGSLHVATAMVRVNEDVQALKLKMGEIEDKVAKMPKTAAEVVKKGRGGVSDKDRDREQALKVGLDEVRKDMKALRILLEAQIQRQTEKQEALEDRLMALERVQDKQILHDRQLGRPIVTHPPSIYDLSAHYRKESSRPLVPMRLPADTASSGTESRGQQTPNNTTQRRKKGPSNLPYPDTADRRQKRIEHLDVLMTRVADRLGANKPTSRTSAPSSTGLTEDDEILQAGEGEEDAQTVELESITTPPTVSDRWRVTPAVEGGSSTPAFALPVKRENTAWPSFPTGRIDDIESPMTAFERAQRALQIGAQMTLPASRPSSVTVASIDPHKSPAAISTQPSSPDAAFHTPALSLDDLPVDETTPDLVSARTETALSIGNRPSSPVFLPFANRNLRQPDTILPLRSENLALLESLPVCAKIYRSPPSQASDSSDSLAGDSLHGRIRNGRIEPMAQGQGKVLRDAGEILDDDGEEEEDVDTGRSAAPTGPYQTIEELPRDVSASDIVIGGDESPDQSMLDDMPSILLYTGVSRRAISAASSDKKHDGGGASGSSSGPDRHRRRTSRTRSRAGGRR